MSTVKVREVNVVPITKIKIERLDDNVEEDTVQCKICSKGFVTEMALTNHARMEHIDQYLAGEDICVNVDTGKKKKNTKDQDSGSKTSELVSSMQPANVSSLASKDISYIIVKEEIKGSVLANKIRKIASMQKQILKKEKAVVPISGPFECLQPSPHNPEMLCHQMFLSCCDYSVHYRDEHTRRRKGHRCQVCEKRIAGDEQSAPYTCQICGMGFDNAKDLAEHGQTAHVKHKPFQCSMCLKRFTQMGGLQQHTRMHTGDRPFRCTFCPKGFTQKSGLDQHLRIHTKVRPYRCVICSKSFCQSVHLQQHMRTHTNVAPFQCGICEKRFKQSSHLNYHLKYHNMVKMTDEQKQKYAELMHQMIKQENVSMIDVEVEFDNYEDNQSEINQTDYGSQVTNQLQNSVVYSHRDDDHSDLVHVEIDQSEVMQQDVDESEAIEVDNDQSDTEQCEVTNEDANGETVYILNEGEVWCEDVVCEQ